MQVIQPIMWELLTDEQLREMEGAAAKSYSPQDMNGMLPFFMKGHDVTGIVTLLGLIKVI